MINATASGAFAGVPSKVGSSCAEPPPPLLTAVPGGGGVVIQSPIQSPVQSPIQSPIQAPMTIGGSGPLGAPVSIPTTGAAAALTGADVIMVPPTPIPTATPIVTAPVVTTPTPTTPTPAPVVAGGLARLTTVAPGGSQSDANLVEAALNVLRGSASGAVVVDRLLAAGARVNVLSDAEAAAMGHADAHAFFDPRTDSIYMRRSDLSGGANLAFAAVALAHEGTHLLDDVAGLAEPFLAQASASVAALGGPTTARGLEAQKQALFELRMINETRAFVFAGQVARDLGVSLPTGDPTVIAARGANNTATYNLVWQTLLTSSYNPERRTAAPRTF